MSTLLCRRPGFTYPQLGPTEVSVVKRSTISSTHELSGCLLMLMLIALGNLFGSVNNLSRACNYSVAYTVL
jgi:hypothetical protein